MKDEHHNQLLPEADDTQENSQGHQSNTISHMIKKAYKASSEELERQIKLRHIRSPYPNKNSKESKEPSYREIVETLQALREKMGNQDVQKIIKLLYNNLIQAKKQKQPKQKNKKSFERWQDLLQTYSVQIPLIAPKQYTIRPQIKDKQFIIKEDQERHCQKQLVAQAFVKRNYGLNHLQAEILQTKSSIVIKRQRYTDLAYGVVTEGYRLLEHFLLDQCKRSIKPSDKYEMGALHRVLCNCRLLLNPDDSLTFVKFVRIAFNIQSVSVTEQAAVRLYISLQKIIRSRVGNRQLDKSTQKRQWAKYLGIQRRKQFKRDEFQKFLTPLIERDIINLYIKCEMVSKVKTYLIQTYPDDKNLFTLQSVGGVICKVVRIAIKRVFYYKQKYKDANLPEIMHLDSSYRCKICKAGEALKVRKLLLKLWKTKQQKILKKLPKIINQINNFIMMKDQQKANYVITKTKPNNNVIEKLDFNINVSRTKLTEGFKPSSKDNVVLIGTERNFQHFVNSQNGKKLHYYRKIRQNFNQIIESADEIKLEGEGSSNSNNSKQFSDSNSDSDDYYEVNQQSEHQEQYSSLSTCGMRKFNEIETNGENPTQKLIKQWLQKLNLDFFELDF